MRDDLRRGFLGPGHYTPAKIEIARKLRREATPAEREAWSLLRRNQVRGHYFRRQTVVEGFIVDFFCAKLRLVIELDGAVHDDPDRSVYDRARDEHLTLHGLVVVRVRNHEVSRQLFDRIVADQEKAPPQEPGGAAT